MRIIKSIKEMRQAIAAARHKGQRIGFVPTMGYLHEGHLSLVRQAKKENDCCVVSIFVNPTQFGPKEDIARYPRDFKHDSTLLKKENVDICFYPPDNDIYPQGYLTYIDVLGISDELCGRFRPGHFKGVATVVAKLLNIVQPDVMYVGAKDAQQVVVLRTLVKDLNIPVVVKTVETKREPDGLAMSSRNVYLSKDERSEASVLYKALMQAKKDVRAGEHQAARVIARMKDLISSESSARIQYIECVDVVSLKPLVTLKGKVLIALAVYFGKTRLIDNSIITVNGKSKTKS